MEPLAFGVDVKAPSKGKMSTEDWSQLGILDHYYRQIEGL